MTPTRARRARHDLVVRGVRRDRCPAALPRGLHLASRRLGEPSRGVTNATRRSTRTVARSASRSPAARDRAASYPDSLRARARGPLGRLPCRCRSSCTRRRRSHRVRRPREFADLVRSAELTIRSAELTTVITCPRRRWRWRLRSAGDCAAEISVRARVRRHAAVSAKKAAATPRPSRRRGRLRAVRKRQREPASR